MGLDVLQELVDSGHLDEAIPDEMPTFTLFESEAVPNPDDPFGYIASENRVPVDQHAHLCMMFGEYCED
jgi:hypothetical protein